MNAPTNVLRGLLHHYRQFKSFNVLNQQVDALPSRQVELDLFKGEWAGALPGEFSHLTAGKLPLFNDSCLAWGLGRLGPITGLDVLELGPLEGSHSYMLAQAGAKSITAVESNQRAFLKCLIVKNMLDIPQAHFLCGDFVKYMESKPPKVDLCVASGVLYHMTNPAQVIDLIAQVSDRVYLWTHYFDADTCRANRNFDAGRDGVRTTHNGFAHTLHRHEYQSSLRSISFFGGTHSYSSWMSRDDILGCLRHFGFTEIEVAPDAPNPNGPAIGLVASKPRI